MARPPGKRGSGAGRSGTGARGGGSSAGSGASGGGGTSGGGAGPRKLGTGGKAPGSGGRGGTGGKQRVKTARGRTASSVRWLDRQLNDPYVKRAHAEGYRSRAAYKLIELDERFGFVRQARAVVDLGIAPGGWSQVVRKQQPRAAVVGIDLLPCDPIDGVVIFEKDFNDDDAPDLLIEALGAAPDLVLSDMAANTVGHPATDHLRTTALVELAADFAIQTLAPGGTFVAKVFAGGTGHELLTQLKKHFTSVKHAKPPASRKSSPELYVVAQGFKGRASDAPDNL